MKVHQTLEWLNLLSLGTKGLKPRQQSVYSQGSVTGGGWRGQHLNSQQHSLTTPIRHFVSIKQASTLFSCIVYTDLSSQPPPLFNAGRAGTASNPACCPPCRLLSLPYRPGRQVFSVLRSTTTHRWQKFRPKSSKGATKKNFWPNFGWFYQKQAEKGPQKIFKRCSLFLAVITVINLIFNIQYTNFLRPLFCLFLVKISQNSARNFFLWPLLSFLAGISAW